MIFKRPTFYLALIGIVAITALILRLRQGDPPSTPLVEPPSSPYENSIGARGIVESVDENVRIAPEIPGVVSEVFVEVGDKVAKGDALFAIDDREERAQMETQEKQLAVLEARLREAQVTLADRRDQFQRTQALRQKNVASEDEQKRQLFALRAAESAIQRADADLQLAQAQLQKEKVDLDRLLVRAPRTGEILQVNVREGEFAAADPDAVPILLGDVQSLQLRADVDESNASRVPMNCEAVAYLKGTRTDPIPLKFVRIEPYIVPKRSLTGESTERVDTRVLQVIFHFDPPPFPVYVGQQMDVFINGQKLEG